ncbi:MAG: GGDEF domain-containing protein [Rivularia sp. (in: Bacteria)]|nr:GGDEF domain-containing protein [Rivularia sp. MS3]
MSSSPPSQLCPVIVFATYYLLLLSFTQQCWLVRVLGICGLPSELITVSLGVGNMLANAKVESTSLINLAEQALYQVKGKGRNRVVLR